MDDRGWETEAQAQNCKENLSRLKQRTSHVLRCRNLLQVDVLFHLAKLDVMHVRTINPRFYDLDGWRFGIFLFSLKAILQLMPHLDTTRCCIMRYEVERVTWSASALARQHLDFREMIPEHLHADDALLDFVSRMNISN